MCNCSLALEPCDSNASCGISTSFPVLGGNASGEIRVYCAGEAKNDIVKELAKVYAHYDHDDDMFLEEDDVCDCECVQCNTVTDAE